MIRWCTFCQTYLGESEPFDQYHITHGACPTCLAAFSAAGWQPQPRTRPLADYYARVAQAGASGTAPAELLQEGLDLGLDPWDLLMGVITPALRNIGERWADGLATVAEEHRLTAICAAILALLETGNPAFPDLRRKARPEVLLVGAETNQHNMGLHLVEFFLLTRAIAVRTATTALDTDAVLALVRELGPAKVGISCSMPGQLAGVRATVLALAALPEPERPRIYLGGYAMRGQGRLIEDLPCRLCTTPLDLLDGADGRERLAAPERRTRR